MNKIIISICLLAFNLIYTYSNAQPEPSGERVLDKVIAIVGNQPVLLSEVEEQFFQMKARGMNPKESAKCEIFEQMLFQKMLIVQAKIDSIEVSEKQVEAEVEGRIQQIMQQFETEKALEEYFGKSLPEIKEGFMDPVRDQLIARNMQMEITKDVKITPSDVKKFFQEIPKDSLPILDATYEISQITMKPEMTQEEKDYQWKKLGDIRKRIVENNEDFATLAVLYSEDPGSAKVGGRYQSSRDDIVPEFASVVFNMEVDSVSEIVETDYGIHIIKLLKKQGNKVDYRHILIKPIISSKSKLAAKEKLDSIAHVIRTDTLTFEQAAMKYSDDEDTRLAGGVLLNPYTRTNQFELKHIYDPSIKYALQKLKPGEISSSFESTHTGTNAFKIIYLKNKIKAHTVNMNDDYQMIQEMALNDKKQQVLDEWVQEKQENTYIKIEDTHQGCDFDFPGWVR